MTQFDLIVGIDLGTSNSTLSWKKVGKPRIHTLEIEQSLSESKTLSQKALPSFAYLLNQNEKEMPSIQWSYDNNQLVVGEWAKLNSSISPARVINSAKSWLCHKNINPEENILPWNEKTDKKFSPVKITSYFLKQLKSSFESHFETTEGSRVNWEKTKTIITVPASFDEVARNLTVKAANLAEFSNVHLLEEPQAAFYAWLEKSGKSWSEQVNPDEVILVCDIGGGTSDFSLIAVEDHENTMTLNRIGVGKHLLLGGDNIDLALAHFIKSQLEEENHNIDQWQFHSLIASAREAKEKMLSDDSIMEIPFTLASKGSDLFASAITTTLRRETLEQITLEGYFPKINNNTFPESLLSIGFSEIGLEYEKDPAITKHIAKFLHDSYNNINQDKNAAGASKLSDKLKMIVPDKILFNGGVFNSTKIKDRILQTVRSWDNGSLEILDNDCLETSVSYGGTYFGSVNVEQNGVKIKSGIPRSFYLGIESSAMAIPGIKPKVKGICIIPQGAEEGMEFSLNQQQFGLQTGQEVKFKFFTSRERITDQIGTIINDADKELEEAHTMQLTLDTDQDVQGMIPVHLNGEINDLGTMNLYMNHTQSDRKWKLHFDVRDSNE